MEGGNWARRWAGISRATVKKRVHNQWRIGSPFKQRHDDTICGEESVDRVN
jgi:hypothetical protein